MRPSWLSSLLVISMTATLFFVASPAYADNDFDNSLVADKGLEEVGTVRPTGWNQPGECIKSVQRWVANAGGSFLGGGVISGYTRSGAVEVALSNAVKGDVIQYTNANGNDQDWSHVHTVVVVKNHGNGKYDIVQSNAPVGSGKVTAPTNWTPAPAPGWVARVWRFGSVAPGPNAGQDGYYHGTPPDGMIVESPDGTHLYVAAGGALFWFDRGQYWEAFLAQRRRLLGEIPVPKMTYNDIHALEANYPTLRHRVPRDGLFFYEVGSAQQYMMLYGNSFPVTGSELDYLGGRDRAIMIPPNNAHHFGGVPDIPNDVLLRDNARPEVFHTVWNMLYHANNATVLDCVIKVKGGRLQPAPVSMMNRLFDAGKRQGITACSFPGHWAIHAGGAERWHVSGANPYVRSRYIDALALHCRLGTEPQHAEVSVAAVNGPAEVAPIRCLDHTFVRNRNTGAAYQVRNHILHYIPWPEMLNCLTHGNPSAVIDMEGWVIDPAPKGEWAYCDFEGKQIRSPDGRVWWIKQGIRRQLPNDTIVHCLKGRAGTGDVLSVTWETVASHTLGAWAYCPYLEGANFVKEANNPTVWRVYPDGTKQHANGFCVPDPWTTPLLKYRVSIVPDGETSGHSWDGSVFGVSAASCQALPG